MGLEDFEAIFGEAKEESIPSRQFVFHVYAPDPSHLKVTVTDFLSNTYQVVPSLSQLEDMRDSTGIGGSWSDFLEYVIASFKSDHIKLLLATQPKLDVAKLIAQKSKGMPRISISLIKLSDAASIEAISSLSLDLFKAFKSMQHLVAQDNAQSFRLTEDISTDKEKNESIHSQLELQSKRPKLQHMNSSDRTVAFAPSASNCLQISPDKRTAQHMGKAKAVNRVVPTYRREYEVPCCRILKMTVIIRSYVIIPIFAKVKVSIIGALLEN